MFLGVFAGVQEAQAGAAPSTVTHTYVTREDYENYKKAYDRDVGNLKYSSGTPNYVTNGESLTSAVGKLDTQAKKNHDAAAKALNRTGDLQYAHNNYVADNDNLTTAVGKLDGQVKTNANAIDGIQRNYVKGSDLDGKVADAGYAKRAYVDDKLANAGYITEGALAGYAKKADVNAVDGKVGSGNFGNATYAKGNNVTEAVVALDGKVKMIADDYVKGSEIGGQIADALRNNNGELTDAIVGQIEGRGYVTGQDVDGKIAPIAQKVGSANFTGKHAAGSKDLTEAVNNLDDAIKGVDDSIEGRITSALDDYQVNVDDITIDDQSLKDYVNGQIGDVAAKVGNADFSGTSVAGSQNLTEAVKNLDAHVANNYVSNEQFSNKLSEELTNNETIQTTINTNIENYFETENNRVMTEVTRKIDNSVNTLQKTLIGEDHDSGVVGTMIDNRISNEHTVLVGDGTLNNGSIVGDMIQAEHVALVGEDGNSGIVGTMIDNRIANSEVVANLSEDVASLQGDVTSIKNTIGDTSIFGEYEGKTEYIKGDISSTLTTMAGTLEDHESRIGTLENSAATANTNAKTALEIIGADSVEGFQAQISDTHYAKEAGNVAEAIVALDDQTYANTQKIAEVENKADKNADNIEALNERMNQYSASVGGSISALNNKVNKLDKKVKTGFASNAALSALVPNARAIGNTQLSAGTGYYDGEFGGAVGVFHYFNDNVLLNAGVSYAGDESLMARAGLSFGF